MASTAVGRYWTQQRYHLHELFPRMGSKPLPDSGTGPFGPEMLRLGRHVIFGSDDKTVPSPGCWDWSCSRHTSTGLSEAMQPATYSPDGRYIIFGSKHKAV